MNKYTCLNCGKVSIIRLNITEHTMLCTCTGKPQKHKFGVHAVKAGAKQDAVPLVPVVEAKHNLPEPPVVFDASKPVVGKPTAPVK